MKVLVPDMMAKLFAANGYSEPVAEPLPNGRDFRVIVYKGDKRAEALGRSPLDGAEKLLRVITRP